MPYQSDYVLRLIEQMGTLIKRALEAQRTGGAEQPYDLAREAVALALDVDPATAERLAPSSLASLLDLSNHDDRVIRLVAEALDIQAVELEARGEVAAARLRRDQSSAARDLIDRERPN